MQPAEPTAPPPRRRRQHKRSRNGCYTCKQRHIRCDEQKPICTNCLVRGGACGYPVKANTVSSSTTNNEHNHGANHATNNAGASSSNTTNYDGTATDDGRHMALSDFVASWPLDDMGAMSTSTSGDGNNMNLFGSDLAFRPSYSPFFSPTLPMYQSSDPFDSLPVTMPLHSMELFHHMTHFRLFTRALVAKTPMNSCITLIRNDAGLFRSSLLLAAMHYSWINGGLADMEGTFLYHKVEAIRLVNDHISDPAWSEICANIIAALAVAESGIGDIDAAEAHLNGLFTLINWRIQEECPGRLQGLFERLILVAGTFIAASKGLGNMAVYETHNDISSMSSNLSSHIGSSANPDFTRLLFEATKPSPFYFTIRPGHEPASANAQNTAITRALRSLSLLHEIDIPKEVTKNTRVHARPSSSSTVRRVMTSTSSKETPKEDEGISMDQELSQVLLLETESYLTHLLFPPDAPLKALTLGFQMYQPPEQLTSLNNFSSAHRQAETEIGSDQHSTPTLRRQGQTDMASTIDHFAMNFDPQLLSPNMFFDAGIHSGNTINDTASGMVASSAAASPATSHATISTNNSAHSANAAYSAAASPLPFRTPTPSNSNSNPNSNAQETAPSGSFGYFPDHGSHFDSISDSLIPHFSLGLPAAAYLYLHIFLADLWITPRPPSYLPSNYPPPTQSRIDRDLRRRLVDTVCASLEHTREAMLMGSYSRDLWIWKVFVGAYVLAKARDENKLLSAASKNTQQQGKGKQRTATGPCIDPTLLGAMDMRFEHNGISSAAMPSEQPEYFLGAWFRSQMRVWADAVDSQHWNDAKRQASAIAWPQNSWAGESVIEDLWTRAMSGKGSP